MERTVEVSLGEHVLQVPQGGYYDRYRMRADLDEVAEDPRVPSVEFFRTLPKRVVESPIGQTSTPNFYYAMRMVQISMLAPIGSVWDRLPHGLAPLQPAPGLGLVALTFFAYDACDVDPYNEATVAIAVRPPRHAGLAELDFLQAMQNDTVYGYPLSLPVTTEIARVRGVYGYGLPKWRTDIEITLEPRITAHVTNESGSTDVAVELPLPPQTSHKSGTKVRTSIALSELDGAWHESKSSFNVLLSGSRFLPRRIQISRGSGRMSDDLGSLNPIRPIAVDAMIKGQLALDMPVPTSINSSGGPGR